MRTAAVILAGTHEWQRELFDALCPRPLMPVANRALVARALDWARAGGICEAVVCTNRYAPLFRRTLGAGDRLGMQLLHYQDVTPRGPAGCAADAARLIDADRVLVIEGTVLPVCDAADVLYTHDAERNAATVVIEDTDYGYSAPAGVFVLQAAALERVGQAGYHDIKEGLIRELREGGQRVGSYRAVGRASRVLDRESYLHAQQPAIRGVRAELEGYDRAGEALIHETAEVDASARFYGPVMIGPRAVVERRATLIGPVVLGSGAVCREQAIIVRTVLWSGSEVGAAAHVDHSILAGGFALAPEMSATHEICVNMLGERPASAGVQKKAATATMTGV
ncbi:hypothetical protein RAS1_04530 [Phycisphaerae bacterium RAS1]|nr:hypothetical protein RAS1_04530 [Phycisphaerae bacterium RAS1]